MDKIQELKNTISDKILEVARLSNEVDNSDLQGIAEVEAENIINLIIALQDVTSEV